MRPSAREKNQMNKASAKIYNLRPITNGVIMYTATNFTCNSLIGSKTLLSYYKDKSEICFIKVKVTAQGLK
jgi:hypothetical protein